MIQTRPGPATPAMGRGIAVMLPPAPQSTVDADGSMLVDLSPDADMPALSGLGHDDDLAGVLPDGVLGGLVDDLIEAFEADWESNTEYRDTIKEGLLLLGLKPGQRINLPFDGAAGVVHPMMLEAWVRFYVNAVAELLPAGGPARMEIVGDAEPGAEAISKRKTDWMNFYLTKKDRGYRPDAEQGIMMTGGYGSTFKKVYQDPRRGRPIARTLTAFDLVVSANTTSLDDADRITQIERVTRPEMRRLQLAGYYQDIDLSDPTETQEDDRPGDREASTRTDDSPHEVLHVHALLDIQGLEHGDDSGISTGLPLPYIVTIEKESRRVLRLVRNYNADDPLFLPRSHFVHYKYLPGLGFYGWGLINLVGQSADAATMVLRQALNSNTLESFPGGFKARGLKVERSTEAIAPCEFRDIDVPIGQPIQAAIMALPYKGVSGAFGILMETIVGAGQRLGSTADIAVGDGREDAPVGTTVALLEKATKIESAVVKSMHGSMGQELLMLADLFGKDLDEKYPYLIAGRRGVALASDFQNNDDIVPVSDPNAPTQTQRLALADGKMKLAAQAGPRMDQNAALEDMLRAMGTTDAEMQRLMPPQPQPVSADPVTELQAIMSGKAVAARPDQDHAAHIAVHGSQVAMPGVAQTPMAAMLAAHMAEHVGMLYRMQVGMALGQPLPPVGPLPPQVEMQITQAVATVAAQVAQSMPGAQQPATKPDIGPNETALKVAEMQQRRESEARKAEQSARDDAVQVAQMNAMTQEGAADREQKQRDNSTKIAAAIIAAMAQIEQDRANLTRATVEGTAEVMAEGSRQAVAVRQQDHDAGMALLEALREASKP